MILLEYVEKDAYELRLAETYWALNESGGFSWSVPALSSYYGISAYKLRKRANHAAVATVRTYPCDSCGAPITVSSRSAYLRLCKSPRSTCRRCETVEQEALKARKEKEEARRYEELQEKEAEIRDKIKKIASKSRFENLDPAGLDLREVVYLLALGRCDASESYVTVGPLSQGCVPLSPTQAHSQSIIARLLERKLIVVDPDSELSALSFKDGRLRFDHERVRFRLAVGDGPDGIRDFFLSAEAMFAGNVKPAFEWPDAWLEQLDAVWREVQIEQAISYFNRQLRTLNMPLLKGGSKTRDLLDCMLRIYSLAQVFYFIWRSARAAGEFYLRKSVSRTHATNAGVSYMRRIFEQASSDQREIPYYREDREAAQSAVVATLRYTVTRLGENLFQLQIPLTKSALLERKF